MKRNIYINIITHAVVKLDAHVVDFSLTLQLKLHKTNYSFIWNFICDDEMATNNTLKIINGVYQINKNISQKGLLVRNSVKLTYLAKMIIKIRGSKNFLHFDHLNNFLLLTNFLLLLLLLFWRVFLSNVAIFFSLNFKPSYRFLTCF